MAYFLPILLLLYLAYMANRKRKTAILRKMIQNRNTEDKTKMKELAKQFIGKECLVYAFDNSQQFDGVIKEVTDGALLIEKNEQTEAVNLDFVIRIREYPKNKKGKKKSVVLD